MLEDVAPLSESVWPYDTSMAPDTSPPSTFARFRCFVLCPFDRSDVIIPLVRLAAAQIQGFLQHEIAVYYAGDLSGSRAIHPDIWVHTRQADVVVADLTGHNANVVLELGVAAAWRPLGTVLMVRDEADGQKSAFDLQPARQILYDSRQRAWSDPLVSRVARGMYHCLVKAPFSPEPPNAPCVPLEFSFAGGRDTPDVWSPSPGHRRMIDGALEFGSPAYFPYSWLSLAGYRASAVRVRARMRFTHRMEPCWIGVALRSQGYLADQEHLIWLNNGGAVLRTGPGEHAIGKDERRIGSIPGFDPESPELVDFDVSMDETHWRIRVGGVESEVPFSDLSYVFASGRILIQAFKCRAAIESLAVYDALH